MKPSQFLVTLFLITAASSLRAVETFTAGSPSYNTNNNISSSNADWSTGWGSGNTNTGWNYVGQVSDASGVYLGNGWVITAAHVSSPTTFTLNGNVYASTGVYHSNFTNSATGTTNADIRLFQVSTISTTGTNLPLTYNLTIMPNAPTPGSTVLMLGYGYTNGAGPETWGRNSVSATSTTVNVNPYSSVDFLTPSSGASYCTLVNGDSGGGDFINVGTPLNPIWNLAGINEATSQIASYMVQLGSYSSQINGFVSPVPEPSTWALLTTSLLVMGCILVKKRSS